MAILFDVLCEGYIAKMSVKKDNTPNPLVRNIQSRLHFWVNHLGSVPIDEITPEMVDAGLVALAQRGKLKPLKNKPTLLANKPLSGATIARYFSELAGCFKYARKAKLVARNWIPPTRGADLPEVEEPDSRYFDAHEVDRLIKEARMHDKHWGRMPALIEVAFCTGLRSGNLKALSWADVDLDAGVVAVDRTKNGDPIHAPLSSKALEELRRLPDREGLVFKNRQGNAFYWRKLWDKITVESGFEGYNFHLLRHSCGSAMAKAGVSQANIMNIMGHRTLHASKRYMHLNTSGKAEVIAKVFG